MTAATVLGIFRMLRRARVKSPESAADGDGGAQLLADLQAEWLDVLGDETDADVLAAFRAWRRTPAARFWPQPGELTPHLPARVRDISAEAAWALAVRYAGDPGGRATPGVDFWWPEGTAVLYSAALDAIGGWQRLAYSSYREHPAMRRAFVDAWHGVARLPASSPLRLAFGAPPPERKMLPLARGVVVDLPDRRPWYEVPPTPSPGWPQGLPRAIPPWNHADLALRAVDASAFAAAVRAVQTEQPDASDAAVLDEVKRRLCVAPPAEVES